VLRRTTHRRRDSPRPVRSVLRVVTSFDITLCAVRHCLLIQAKLVFVRPRRAGANQAAEMSYLAGCRQSIPLLQMPCHMTTYVNNTYIKLSYGKRRQSPKSIRHASLRLGDRVLGPDSAIRLRQRFLCRPWRRSCQNGRWQPRRYLPYSSRSVVRSLVVLVR
jgi:hypothetical protein